MGRSCPACKDNEWDATYTDCPICGRELLSSDDSSSDKETSGWLLVGTIDELVSANLAREALKSAEIPAVVISKSGYFGQVGLIMNNFLSGAPQLFEVSVPTGFEDDAIDLLTVVVGDHFTASRPAE